MSSVFVTEDDRTIRGFAGKRVNIPFYLQFVSGYTVDVVHSEESFEYGGPSTINSIIALPHYTDKVYKTRATTGEKQRYYPLLRSHGDIPSKGDPVLLCTIGRINYYLGPLNTFENSPTWNDDPSFQKEILTEVKRGVKEEDLSDRGIAGESLNFNKEVLYPRLRKRQTKLDLNETLFETSGDYVIEGRHGNSLRIGSRSNNPYIFISNDRMSTNTEESIVDGTIISITSNGTLADHFESYAFDTGQDLQEIFGFKLASDFVEPLTNEPPRYMEDLITYTNGGDSGLLYGYNGNQTLINSDRITINSKLDDIYLSSKKNIHIGARENLTISTVDDLIISSGQTFLGSPIVGGSSRSMDNLVLADNLIKVLESIVDLIPKIKILTQLGTQDPVQGSAGEILNTIDELKKTFNTIKSNNNFIEPN